MALRIKYRVNKKVYINESEFLKIEMKGLPWESSG